MFPKQLTNSYLIICEGNADRAFLKHLFEVRGLEGDFEIVFPKDNFGYGNSAFGTALNGLIPHRDFNKLKGIILITDCDETPDNSFRNIQAQVKDTEFNVPNNPCETVQTPNKPALAIVMIPFDNVCGNLESYIVRAMSDTWNDVKTSADRHISETPASGWRTTKKSKAIMQCMIAVLHESDPNNSLAYIWSNSEEFCEILKHQTFDDLVTYFREFARLLNNEAGD